MLFTHASAPRDLSLVWSSILRLGLGSLVLGLGFFPFVLTSYPLRARLGLTALFRPANHIFHSCLLTIWEGSWSSASLVCPSMWMLMTHTCVTVCCLSLPCVIGLGMPSSLLSCTPSVVFAGLSGFNGRLWVETPVLLPGPPSQNPHPVAYLDGLSGCPRTFSGT